MLIHLNNNCSTVTDQGRIRRDRDLVSRSLVQPHSYLESDRQIAPLAQARSPLTQQENSSELQALRQVAYLGEQQKRRDGSIRKQAIASYDIDQPVGNFAAPLSPLKERDLNALAELFLTDKMSTIETDVAQLLLRLQPEPCWEDNPFTFLQDFL